MAIEKGTNIEREESTVYLLYYKVQNTGEEKLFGEADESDMAQIEWLKDAAASFERGSIKFRFVRRTVKVRKQVTEAEVEL